MLTVSTEVQQAAIAQMAQNGLAVSRGNAARTKFTGGESLTQGAYTPVIAGPQPAVVCPPRRKGGSPYDAIAFRNPAGSIVKVGLGSILNSIRVVEGMNPATLVRGAKWLGESAQPTKNYFRYGALSDMDSADVPDTQSADGTTAYYQPSAFTLTTEVVYVVPRFVQGSNRPIFDEQCDLRKAFVVADYTAHADNNATR